MSLVWQPNEIFDGVVPALEALRDHEADTFVLGGQKHDRLYEIREDLLRIDFALRELIRLNPDHRETYIREHAETEKELERQIAALHIPGFRTQPL